MIKLLQRLFISFIARYIPSKGKRMLFILICYCIWSKNNDEKIIRDQMIEINNRLNLSKDSDALSFAIGLRNILLTMDDIQPMVKDNDKDDLVNKMPDWLKYNSPERMKSDLYTIYKYTHAV